MERRFAEAVAFMIWADFYDATRPTVAKGVGQGRLLGFTDELIVLIDEADETFCDGVALDHLAYNRASAEKLSAWLGDMLEFSEHGVAELESGFSAWACREDGKVLEVSCLGYQLYDDKAGFDCGDRCEAALRR